MKLKKEIKMTEPTAADLVLGLCKSMGPVTTSDMVSELRLQLPEVNERNESSYATLTDRVVPAINKLMREGKIELYDTGNAWTSV